MTLFQLCELYDTAWAIISPSYLRAMERLIREPEARVNSQPAADAGYQNVNGVAIVGLKGVMLKQAPAWLEEFGFTSTEGFTQRVAAAAADPAVKSIVLNVASPGGSVMGVQAAHDAVAQAAASKRVVAVANSMMASAAYYVSAAANEIATTVDGLVGSIGVYTIHEDISRMADNLGVTVSMISAGKYKVEGNEFQPLGAEARNAMQEQVDYYYAQFVNAVAKGRGTTANDVRSGYGEGRALTADKAISSRLVDRVATLTQIVNDEAARAAATPATVFSSRLRIAEAELAIQN